MKGENKERRRSLRCLPCKREKGERREKKRDKKQDKNKTAELMRIVYTEDFPQREVNMPRITLVTKRKEG